MRVLYFNNCWFTNVGEAFIDIGGMFLVNEIFGTDVKIANISAMSDYYANNAPIIKTKMDFFCKNNVRNFTTFKMSDYMMADFVILPGMVGTIEFLKAPSRKMIDKLVSKGCKVIFLGLGGEKYNSEEYDAIKEYFDEIKPALVMTRDNETYELYKNIVPCVRGLDCAFWSVDAFDPRGFYDKEYDVVTFNRINEPDELKPIVDSVVRPIHMQYSFRKEYCHDNMMISDTPYDYLTLYANARKVYTDLVHATITSLMYGTPVKYWRTDKRCQAFYALDELECNDGWLSVSEKALIKQKKIVVEECKKIIF